MTLPFRKILVLLAASSCVVGQVVHGQSTAILESVIDWKKPLEQDAATFEKAVRERFPNARRQTQSEKKAILFLIGSGGDDKCSVLGDTAVDSCYAVLTGGRLEALNVEIRAGMDVTATKLKEIYESDPKPVTIQFADGSKKEGLIWRYPQFEIVLSASGDNTILYVTEAQPESPSTASAAEPLKVKVDLDILFKPEDLWKLSAEGLEKLYTADTPGKMQDPPQFAWLDEAKTRARFYRKLYANLDTRLTMFGGSIKVEEAILEFSGGKAVRATISFYNRGDAGPMTREAFEKLYKVIGQNLGQVYHVVPRSQLMSSNAALKTIGWVWTTPANVAVLEYADYLAPAQPEFLRLKLAAPGQENWSMGQLAVAVQRMGLMDNVKKNVGGDVYISGVPMVDQGAKGYCVAASCQRLFEYMHIPCDQHEMADLLHIEANKGADVYEMQKCLARIDGKFNVTFKLLINAQSYFDSKGKRRVSLKEFTTIIREHVAKGIPLLWGLQLGIHPEDPPLPGDGQTVGGHMRMIIGYNTEANKILFSDSWGAGHELKRMDLADAYDVTVGLYAVTPRGL